MNPSEIKATLASLGAKPNKALGQHFLIDDAALGAILDAADIHAGDQVLEVGPGLGVLTGELLNARANVTAIEQDRTLVPFLEKRFAKQPLTLVPGDASTIHWHELIEEEGDWKFISNLPYSITSLAIRKALWSPRPAERVVVLVQREVAERAIAKDGKTSLLSLMVSLASTSARIVRRVPAGAFFPPPKVESAILEIFTLPLRDRVDEWGVEPEKIMALAKRGFAHPRKHLAANLVDATHTKDAIQSIFRIIKVNELARAEDLTPEEWAALTKTLTP